MKPLRTSQLTRIMKYSGIAVAVVALGFVVWLVWKQQTIIRELSTRQISQTELLDFQTDLLEFIAEDSRSDECRDGMEQRFLATVGTLIVRQVEGNMDQLTVDRLSDRIRDLDNVDDICPHPIPPQPETVPNTDG